MPEAKIEITCSGCEKVQKLTHGAFDSREEAASWCAILDGTHPLFVTSPRDDPRGLTARCVRCNELFDAKVVGWDGVATTDATILADAEGLHSQYPETFELPSEESRRSLSIGDFAKLIFRNHRGHTERMWVEVLGVSSDGVYGGRLDNEPFLAHAILVLNATVVFEAKHVIEIRPRLGRPI